MLPNGNPTITDWSFDVLLQLCFTDSKENSALDGRKQLWDCKSIWIFYEYPKSIWSLSKHWQESLTISFCMKVLSLISLPTKDSGWMKQSILRKNLHIRPQEKSVLSNIRTMLVSFEMIISNVFAILDAL